MTKIFRQVLVLAIMAVISAGCGIKENALPPDSNAEHNSGGPVGSVDIDYGNVTAVTINDVAADMYGEPLVYALTEDELEEFRNAVDFLEVSDRVSGQRGVYRLKMTDREGAVIDTWEVDSGALITTASGVTLKRAGAIADWLDALEETYPLDLTSVWGRRPGSGYFANMLLAVRGSIDELAQNEHAEAMEHEFTADELAVLAEKLLAETTAAESSDLPAKKYIMEVFSEEGKSLYILFVDEECNVYTEYGYLLLNGEAQAFVRDLIK